MSRESSSLSPGTKRSAVRVKQYGFLFFRKIKYIYKSIGYDVSEYCENLTRLVKLDFEYVFVS